MILARRKGVARAKRARWGHHPRRARFLIDLASFAMVLALAGTATAQSPEVPTWIDTVQKQPSGVDRATWKEQRREAAKKLGASGDRRAVPVLIDLAENETFDIIGEIAIDGLGQLGDPAAIPVLQKIANDPARDTVQRDKARKALARLGASADGGLPDVGDTATTEGATVTTGETGEAAAEPLPASDDRFGDGLLSMTERLTFVVGSAAFDYDTVRERMTFDLDGAASYERSKDRGRNASRFGADARILAATVNPEGPATARTVVAVAGGHGEFRAYGGAELLYGIAFGHVRFETSRVRSTDDGGIVNNDRWIAVDAQVALGGGLGRILDVGTRMRVARIASALEKSRSLGRPIDDALARRLQSAWWGLRGRLGAHKLLTTTVAILRDAGVLLGEPDASTTYELLQILEDPAYDGRASGVDVHLAFGEGFLKRWRTPDDENPGGLDEGRLEELLFRAQYARQLDDQSDAGGALFARYRLFAADGEPAPWAVGARAELRRWVYADHFDPRGALDVVAELAASDDDLDNTEVGARVAGELGWTTIISRASSLRLSASAALDAGELFIGARLEARYGLLDGSFAKSLP